ncbi:protein of unknown function [Bartonella clarridgeiae 73]|uniref:Uncharacterized protein n=1 Tax=Bartonella clarridgeiae (strain CCUG 45776 / CIP 104772 / 73) TaxID=696125 RepID=E6YIE8_BARC7|nr:protein of unknown function [Bartonella clarridgeiae 73]
MLWALILYNCAFIAYSNFIGCDGVLTISLQGKCGYCYIICDLTNRIKECCEDANLIY